MDYPSRLDLFAIGCDYLSQRAKRIDPSQVFTLGSDANVFVGSQAVVGDVVVKQLIYSSARQFLDGAEDTDLDRLIFDRYGLTRKGASAALGSVVFSRAAATAGSGSIPIGTTLQTLTGVQYVTTSTAAFGPTDLFTSPVFARATQAGKATQVGANAITKIAQPGSLFDPSIQVNNPLAMAGGEDREDDPTVRARVRSFWTTARRGTLGAITFGAQSVPGVVSAQAIEALTGTGLPARVVNLYIADSSGVASQALAAQVQATLEDYRAGGIAVIINTSLPLIVNVQLQLTFQAGVDTVTLGSQVQSAVVEFINTLPVNGALYISQVYTVLQRFNNDGLIPNQASILSPLGDLVPSVGQTLRTTPANVTIVQP